jgi:hypothetical protein
MGEKFLESKNWSQFAGHYERLAKVPEIKESWARVRTPLEFEECFWGAF